VPRSSWFLSHTFGNSCRKCQQPLGRWILTGVLSCYLFDTNLRGESFRDLRNVASTSVMQNKFCVIFTLQNTYITCFFMRSPNSPVGLATRYKFEGQESVVLFPAEVGDFIAVSRPSLETTQPPIQWIMMGVMQPGYKADNSPPSDNNFKSMPFGNSNPSCIFMAW
jgi:hypothetical protein